MASAALDQGADAILPLDVILPAQFFNRAIAQPPEKLLWLAVLEISISDWQGGAVGLNGGFDYFPSRRLRLRAEANEWLFAADGGMGSFEWVCDVLEIDAAFLREGLRCFAADADRRLKARHKNHSPRKMIR